MSQVEATHISVSVRGLVFVSMKYNCISNWTTAALITGKATQHNNHTGITSSVDGRHVCMSETSASIYYFRKRPLSLRCSDLTLSPLETTEPLTPCRKVVHHTCKMRLWPALEVVFEDWVEINLEPADSWRHFRLLSCTHYDDSVCVFLPLRVELPQSCEHKRRLIRINFR